MFQCARISQSLSTTFPIRLSVFACAYVCVWVLITTLSKGDSWAPRVPQGISCSRGDYVRVVAQAQTLSYTNMHTHTHTYTLSRTFPDMTSFSGKQGTVNGGRREEE